MMACEVGKAAKIGPWVRNRLISGRIHDLVSLTEILKIKFLSRNRAIREKDVP